MNLIFCIVSNKVSKNINTKTVRLKCGMNLDFLIKKKHIFRQRKKRVSRLRDLSEFSNGIFSLNKFRFEFVYLKVIKKLFRKKYFKRDISYLTKKY